MLCSVWLIRYLKYTPTYHDVHRQSRQTVLADSVSSAVASWFSARTHSTKFTRDQIRFCVVCYSIGSKLDAKCVTWDFQPYEAHPYVYIYRRENVYTLFCIHFGTQQQQKYWSGQSSMPSGIPLYSVYVSMASCMASNLKVNSFLREKNMLQSANYHIYTCVQCTEYAFECLLLHFPWQKPCITRPFSCASFFLCCLGCWSQFRCCLLWIMSFDYFLFFPLCWMKILLCSYFYWGNFYFVPQRILINPIFSLSEKNRKKKKQGKQVKADVRQSNLFTFHNHRWYIYHKWSFMCFCNWKKKRNSFPCRPIFDHYHIFDKLSW